MCFIFQEFTVKAKQDMQTGKCGKTGYAQNKPKMLDFDDELE